MFKLDLTPSYWWQVKFQVASENGTHQAVEFTAQYRRLTQPEIEALINRAAGEKKSDSDIARDILVGWEGVADGDGKAVPFNRASLDRALAVPGFGSGVVKAFFESLSQAASKN